MKTKFNIDGREYVDMGSDVLWATCNLGANSPEEFGDYFAFGEIEKKEEYSPENYEHYHPDGPLLDDFTWNSISEQEWDCDHSDCKGRHQYGLLSNYDAATAILGNPFHIPSHDDLNLLLSVCDIFCNHTLNGVKGALLVSRITGEKLFFPMAKSKSHESKYEDELWGEYYCSTGLLNDDDVGNGYKKTYYYPFVLYIDEDSCYMDPASGELWEGLSIRPCIDCCQIES